MELYKKTAHELRDMIKNKEITSAEATKSVLERIDSVEEKVESYITVCSESAMERADARDGAESGLFTREV